MMDLTDAELVLRCALSIEVTSDESALSDLPGVPYPWRLVQDAIEGAPHAAVQQAAALAEAGCRAKLDDARATMAAAGLDDGDAIFEASMRMRDLEVWLGAWSMLADLLVERDGSAP